MKIKQFEDKGLSHFSYAILSECEQKIVLVDPGRNPEQYYQYAKEHEASIIGVIETHPHADFVSSHLEIHQTTGATIYASKLAEAGYPHQSFDEGVKITFGKITLVAVNTPGHSPDSISVILQHEGTNKAVFTGDTLFIGDVGRPDLREKGGALEAMKETLARQMYHSTRNKLMKLDPHVLVYPAHGSGSLCGKSMSDATESTIGEELSSNPSLQEMSEDEFVRMLLEDQPFIPKYFKYDVELNKQGASAFAESVKNVPALKSTGELDRAYLVIDTRSRSLFNADHIDGAINLQDGGKFETWLGSIVGPDESFYILTAKEEDILTLLEKAAKIGYESNIKGALVYSGQPAEEKEELEVSYFKEHQDQFTILDVRNASEVKSDPKFGQAINIPLPELREHLAEIPANKPIMVHCAGGYRSAAAYSIIKGEFPGKEVIDLSEAIKNF